MSHKLSNSEVDARLSNRPIKRIGNFVNIYTKCLFECSICHYQWKVNPNNILRSTHPTNCPKCAGNQKLSNSDIDNKLINRNIQRIDNVINAKTPIHFQCLIENCKFTWKTDPDHVINQMTSCPKCAGNLKLLNEDIDAKLVPLKIKRIGDYISATQPLAFQCLICNHQWKSTASGPICRKTSCPKCAEQLKLTNEIIDERLKNTKIKRIGNYLNMKTSIHFQCLNDNCNHIWLARPYNIIHNERGCPQCFLKKNEKLIGKLLKQNNIVFEQQKPIKKINISETKRLYVDYFLPDFNVIIEYNGIQHYQPVNFFNLNQEQSKSNFLKQQIRDKYLVDFCLLNNISLIIIDGRKYKNSKLHIYVLESLIPNLLPLQI